MQGFRELRRGQRAIAVVSAFFGLRFGLALFYLLSVPR
jgi:hypothetical protein